MLKLEIIIISVPLIAPYVRVSYTALHLYDNFKLTQIVVKRIDQTWSILFLNGQNLGTKQKVDYMTIGLSVQTQPSVCYRKYLFICKVTTEFLIQFLQINIYSFWFLPLFNNDNSDFMAKPLTKDVNEMFHHAYSIIVNPPHYNLIDSFECDCNRACNAYPSNKFSSTFIVEFHLALIGRLAFPFTIPLEIGESQELAFGWSDHLGLSSADFKKQFPFQP